MSKKTGIFGGTFDPIHFGHLFLAEAAADTFCLDRVLFFPNPDPYHRAFMQVSPLPDRINMTKLAVFGNPRFEFSSFEIDLPGRSYTSRTLEAFHERFPDEEMYFIMGGDSLFSIEYWKAPEKIFELAVILSAKRSGQSRGASGILHPDTGCFPETDADEHEGTDKDLDKKISELKEKFGARIYNLYVPGIEISSSDIKDRVRDGRSIKYYTPDKVADYIYEKRLYL